MAEKKVQECSVSKKNRFDLKRGTRDSQTKNVEDGGAVDDARTDAVEHQQAVSTEQRGNV